MKEDDGNPSLMQALDYDVDNDDIINDYELYKRVNYLTSELGKVGDEFRDLGKKYNNKKVEKIADSIVNITSKIVNEYLDSYRLEDNRYRVVEPYMWEWKQNYIDKQNADYYGTPYGASEKKK